MEAADLIKIAGEKKGNQDKVKGRSGTRDVVIEQVTTRNRIAVQVEGIGRFLLDPEDQIVLFRPNQETDYTRIADSGRSTGINLIEVLNGFEEQSP